MSSRSNLDGGVSLILPLQDEEESVRPLFLSIAGLSVSPDEIVLVDAGSNDATVNSALSVSVPSPVRVVRQERVYPGVARNSGAAEARFGWLAFTDGGVVLDERWLEELARAIGVAGGPADVVFGAYEPVCDTFFKQCAALAYLPRRSCHGIRGPSPVSCLIGREVFANLGGFPAFRAAEDLLFAEAVETSGCRVAYAPEAVARWQIAGTFGRTFRRFALYSRHNLAAGRGRYWHHGVARLYVLLALSVGSVIALGGGGWAGLLTPIFFLARAMKAGWQKRGSFPFSTLHPLRLLGAAAVLVVIDLGTAVGSIRWLLARGHA